MAAETYCNNMSRTLLCVEILLCIFSLTHAKLECDRDSITQIHSDDVEDHFIEVGYSFHDILLGDDRYWWHSAAIPNIGNLTFIDTWVIMGLSTQGEHIYDQKAFVSSFSIEYVDSLNNSFNEEDKLVFDADSPNEKVFYFNEPITAKALQITILKGVLGGPIFNYYWYLDLIGCLESEAREVYLCSNDTIEDPSTYISTHTTTVTADQSCMSIPTTTACSCINNNPSIAANLQSITSSSSLTMPTESVRVESCSIELIVTIIPSAILLVLLYITIMGWIIYAKLSRKTARVSRNSSNSLLLNLHTKHGKTLRDFKNADLYDKSPTADTPLTTSGSTDTTRDSGMIYNRLYTSTPQVELSQASAGGGTMSEGYYTEVDAVYTSITTSPTVQHQPSETTTESKTRETMDTSRYIEEDNSIGSMTPNLAYMKHQMQ